MGAAANVMIAREDGGVSIMKVHRVDGGASDVLAEEVAKWQSTSDIKATGFWLIADSEVPSNRHFRDAWVHAGEGRCQVDMEKARALHMRRIRASRDRALAALDIPFMKAVETKDEEQRSAIAAAKKRLRDLPQSVDLTVAGTTEQLNAIWPDGLSRR